MCLKETSASRLIYFHCKPVLGAIKRELPIEVAEVQIAAIATFTSIDSLALPLKMPRVGGTSA